MSSFNKNVDHTNYKFREKIVCFILLFGSVFSETCRSSNTFKIVLICLKFSFSIFFSPQGAGRGETLGTRLMFLTIHPSSLENLNLVLKRFENTLGSIISKGNTVATRFIVKVSKIKVLTNVA